MALANEYTFQLNNGVLLNDDDASFPFVDIQKVDGLDSATYRETLRDHEGMDGGFFDAEFEKARAIILEGIIYTDGDTMEPYLDEIKENYAPSMITLPFAYKAPGVAERVLFVKPQGVHYNWDQLRRLGMANIQFLMMAEDPRIYTNSLSTAQIPYSGSVAATGMGFSMGFSFGFGTAVVPDSTSIFVGGNRPTPAIFTITGPIDTPTIYNATLGLTLRFNIVLLTGETLVIDTANRTVLLNGNSNVRGSLDEPNWFDLSPGITIFQFGGLGTTGTSTLDIDWRDAWR